MVVGILQKARVDLHLATQEGLQRVRHVIPCRDFSVPRSEFAVFWDDAQRLLPGERFFTQLVPTSVEFALVFVSPLLRYMMRGMGRAGSEVDEEGLVRCQRLLLRYPG